MTAYAQPVGQFNRYRYANGNPYKFTDPDGRAATCNENRCSGEVNTIADALALPAILAVAYGGGWPQTPLIPFSGMKGLIRPTRRRGEGESSLPIA
ncbi:hypothetical protein [Stenotrophomonas sp. ATs4]|uniref:hypothetical protein n=1 Tax=Stenotrophomonas sp. ATs4 TaxID=3402766 RepID=UPI003F6FBD66